MTGNVQARLRCTECGRRSVIHGACSACGFMMVRTPQEIVTSAPSASVLSRPFELSSTAGGHQSMPLSVSVPRRDILQVRGLVPDGSEIAGRVIIARQAPHEPMDFDPWRWVAIPVWGLFLLVSPIAVSVIVWWTAGFTAAMVVGVILLLILRYLFSNRLLQSWHLTAALNGRHIVEPMPVLMIRLRKSDGSEVQVRVKGQLDGGTLMEGDRIRATGCWRSGAFRVRRVFCERTGAHITPHQPNAFGLAVIGIVCLLLTCLWLWIGAYPWVSNEIHQFRASWNPPVSFPSPTRITP